MGEVYMLGSVSETRSSEQNPVQVSWIETALWPGHLGLTTAPGRTAGDRTTPEALEADLTRLRRNFAAQVLVSLLEPEEGDLQALLAQAEDLGLDVLRYAVADGGVPHDTAAFAEFADEVMNRLLNGETVLAHGLEDSGRAGMLAACLLVQAGMTPLQGLALVQGVSPGALEQPAQRRFVEAFGE